MASSDTDHDIIISSASLIASSLYQRRQVNARKRKRNFMGTGVNRKTWRMWCLQRSSARNPRLIGFSTAISCGWMTTPLAFCSRKFFRWSDAVAALAIDKAGPRPCHFRLGPTSGPATRPGSQKSKISSLHWKKFSMFNHMICLIYTAKNRGRFSYV